MEILPLWGSRKWLPTFHDDHSQIAILCVSGFPNCAHNAAGLFGVGALDEKRRYAWKAAVDAALLLLDSVGGSRHSASARSRTVSAWSSCSALRRRASDKTQSRSNSLSWSRLAGRGPYISAR